MLAYLFPGQGSQTYGMGKDLFAQFPKIMKEADAILGYSLEELCLTQDSRLNQTQFTQPALFTVNALSYFKKLQDSEKPDYVAGHSLGEYNALLAAEVFDYATGLQLVKKRGELMNQEMNGAMSAVIGFKIAEIENFLTEFSSVAIANHNTYLQSVISGSDENIKLATAALAKNNITVIPLKVSGAFHSPLMQPAAEKFTDYLQQFTFNIPKLPVIANVNAEPYHPRVIKTNLANQISHSVRWVYTIETLLQNENITFEEIGPGKVLTGLLKRIQLNQ